jgi:uncharacterized protein
MLKKPFLTLLLLAACGAAQAQAQAASSPAKKELVARILKMQQPAIETLARGLAEEPALQLLARAEQALPRVPQDKQQAVAKEIEADARKYVDETVPIVKDRAIKLAPSTLGALLEEKFSEDELKQVVGILESPAFAKFQQLAPEMQKALAEKLVADTQSTVGPKVRSLEASIGKRLGVSPPAAAANNGGAAAKPPAKK